MGERKRPNILAGITMAYMLVAVAWAVVLRVAERHWLATLLLYTPQHVWLVVPILLGLVAALARNRRALWWNVACLVFVLIVLMGFCFPFGRLLAFGHGTRVRVMTFNIHHCSGGIKAIANTVRRVDPDIVCFQEANTGNWSSEIPKELVDMLPEWHVTKFRAQATLSKYPIVLHRVVEMQPETGRVVMETIVDVRGRPLSVLNTHLNTAAAGSLMHRSGQSVREYMRRVIEVKSFQVQVLRKVAREQLCPVVIMGDMNNPPRGTLYYRLTRGHRDAFRTAGFGYGYTFKSTLPVLRIDYVLVGDGIKVKRAFVMRNAPSDHRPTIADLMISD